MKYGIKYILIAFILLLAFDQSANAYRNVGKGKEFWFAFSSGGFNGSLMICAEKATSGTVSFPNMGWSKNFYVPDSSITTVGLNELFYLNKSTRDKVSNFGIHLVSNEVVTIFSSDDSNIGDHALILPKEAIGAEYLISTYDKGSDPTEANFDCIYYIVATDTNTEIEISPQIKYNGAPPVQNPAYKITLNKGQSYFVAEEGDLSGTFIKSLDPAKKIAVFAGNEKAEIDNNCHELVKMPHPVWEQLYPIDMMDKEYVALPYEYRANGNIIRVMATEDMTKINLSDTNNIVLDKGIFYDTIAYEPVVIKADKKISVTLFSRNKICNLPKALTDTIGEPTMLQLLPINNMYSGTVFFKTLLLGTFNSKRWVTTIFTKTVYTDKIFVDDTSIYGYFKTIKKLPGYSYAHIDLDYGIHKIQSDYYFSASHYAFCANNDMYEWDGGYSLALGAGRSFLEFTTNPVSPICETLPIEFIANAPDEVKYFYWDMGDGNTQTGKIVNYVYPNAGTYLVTLRCKRDSNDVDAWDVHQEIINVVPYEPPVIFPEKLVICPGEQIRLNIYQRFAEYYWSNGDMNSSTKVNKAGIYSVTIVDTNGCVGQTSVEIQEYPVVKPEIGLKGDQIFCEGDSCILTVKNDFLEYKWSNGEKGKSIIVKTTDTYRVVGLDSNGCETSSDPIVITVNSKPKPFITGPNSICKNDTADYFTSVIGLMDVKWFVSGGKILTKDDSSGIRVAWGGFGTGYVKCEMKNMTTGCIGFDSLVITIDSTLRPHLDLSNPYLCKGESVTLTAPPGYKNYLWSNGDTTSEITVTVPGIYFLKVTGAAGCNGISETVVLSEVEKPAPVLTHPVYLCEGEDFYLSTTLKYHEYLWSTGESTDKILITNPGKYSLTVTDTTGCQGFAQTDVEAREVKLTLPNVLNYGKTKIGKTRSRKFDLVNNGNNSVEILRVALKGANTQFFTKTENPLPSAMLAPGAAMNIEIIFAPQSNITVNDSLIIEIQNPCNKYISIPVLAIGTEYVLEAVVSTCDTVGKIGEKGFKIPVYAYLNLKDSILLNQSYTAEITFDKDYFYPESLSKGLITSNKVVGEERVLTFRDSLRTFTDKNTLLTEISGTTLLGEKGKSKIIFNSFELTGTDFYSNLEEGSLELTGVCIQTISQIKQSSALMMMVNNLIKNNNLDIEILNLSDSLNAYPHSLSIYSVFGEKVSEIDMKNIQLTGKSRRNVNADISFLADGKYFLILRVNGTILINQIIIIR